MTTTSQFPALNILAEVVTNLDDQGFDRPAPSHGLGWVGRDYHTGLGSRAYPKVRIYAEDPEADTFTANGVLRGKTTVSGVGAIATATAVAYLKD